MDRIVVIANPSASQFTGGAHRTVMSVLGKAASVETVWPVTAADAEARAAEAAEAGADVVVAMGGDGIVHHVAQGVVDTDASLGIIPAGTTNVIARLLQIPSKPAKAARLLTTGDVAPLPVGTARMTLTRGSVETTHHAVFACGFGLDAAVVLEADKDPYRKYRFGSLHYARTAIGVALGDFPGRKPHIIVTFGDREQLASAALVQFRDVYTYFGTIPLRVTPEEPDPMTLLTIERLRRRRIPRILMSLLRNVDLGVIPGMTVVPHLKAVEIVADPPVAAQADGESLGMVDAGRVEWAAGSLRVISGRLTGSA
ncbi:MAG: diacylglycerol/lipid kinase family protein [Acidimicrobiia bacterium]